MIDRFALKKICLAENFIDPHLLWSYVSTGTIRDVSKFLDGLRAQYPENAKVVESEIIKSFNENLQNKRKRRFLIILLKEAFEKGLISGSTYHDLRKQLLGMEEYDTNTRKAIEERWQNEYKTDPFSVLQGKNSEMLAAASASK